MNKTTIGILTATAGVVAGFLIDKKIASKEIEAIKQNANKYMKDAEQVISKQKQSNEDEVSRLRDNISKLKVDLQNAKVKAEQEPVGIMMGEFKTRNGMVIKSIEKTNETPFYDSVWRIIIEGTHLSRSRIYNDARGPRMTVGGKETIIVLTKLDTMKINQMKELIMDCKSIDDILKLHTKVWYD